MSTPEFIAFPKMARLSREMIVSEKIDGTNAQVFIRELPDDEVMPTETPLVAVVGNLLLYAGSRTRWITPEADNHGFARWVKENSEELAKLGPGRHMGEWWGSGINRGYGLQKGEKRFSLFNTIWWVEDRGDGFRAPLGVISQPDPTLPAKMQEYAPTCCHVVPVLYRGRFDSRAIDCCLENLKVLGSQAAPGFVDPEGVVVFHVAGNVGFKRTLHKDEEPKSFSRKP